MGDKLTLRRVKAAKPGETLWDGEIKGLGLRVWASGARSYFLKFRRGRVQRWHTIGLHGDGWSPETAREEAEGLKQVIREGRDPTLERKQDRQAETFDAFADRYLAEVSDVHKKASTAAGEHELLRTRIRPALGKLRVKDIQASDIERLHASLKSMPHRANRCLSLLSHMFRKAEGWGLRPANSNPVKGIDRFKEKARERFLSPKELARIGRVFAFLDRKSAAPYAVAAIRLLLMTGARRGEVLSLKWKHVDFDARLLRLEDSKTGAKTIALSAPALAVLNSIPRQSGNDFVICGKKPGAALVGLPKFWQRVRKAALVPDVRIHDLRHSFASVAVAGGASLPLIGALLGHKEHQTTMRYAHLGADPRIAAAETIAGTIAAQLAGRPGNVLPMRRQNG